jgi:hypothetical protein
MQPNQCEVCHEDTPGYDAINYGSMEHGYRLLCSRCFNAEVAKLYGLEGFENLRLEPVGIADRTGTVHQFHFRPRLMGDIVALDAFELRDGNPSGYKFMSVGDPEGELFSLLGQLIQKIRRMLSVRHIEDGEHGLQIIDQTVRGRIEWDEATDGETPLVIVDGREISWEALGRRMMTFEGWQFKLEIRDSSDDL